MDRNVKQQIASSVFSLAMACRNPQVLKAAAESAAKRGISLGEYFAPRAKLPTLRNKYGNYAGEKLLAEAVNRYSATMFRQLKAAEATLENDPDNSVALSDKAAAIEAIAECEVVAEKLCLAVKSAANSKPQIFEIEID